MRLIAHDLHAAQFQVMLDDRVDIFLITFLGVHPGTLWARYIMTYSSCFGMLAQQTLKFWS